MHHHLTASPRARFARKVLTIGIFAGALAACGSEVATNLTTPETLPLVESTTTVAIDSEETLEEVAVSPAPTTETEVVVEPTVDEPLAVETTAAPTTIAPTTIADTVQLPDTSTCVGEVLQVSYPAAWFSNMDLGADEIECLWFRDRPIDGHLDHPVKIERLRDISLSDAVTVITANESAVVLSETHSGEPDATQFGISDGGQRVRLELANINVPDTASRVIHLIEAGGSVYQITADQDWAFDVADDMASTIEFVLQ